MPAGGAEQDSFPLLGSAGRRDIDAQRLGQRVNPRPTSLTSLNFQAELSLLRAQARPAQTPAGPKVFWLLFFKKVTLSFGA